MGLRSFSSNKLKDDFYRVSEFNSVTTAAANSSIVGEIIDHAIDLTKARPGETIDVPYEVNCRLICICSLLSTKITLR